MNRLRKDRMLLSKIKATNAWKELDATVDEVKQNDADESAANLELLTQ